MRALPSVMVLVLACASTGSSPPPVGDLAQTCAERFCVEYPDDWEADLADGTIVFKHPLDKRIVASVSVVNMAFLVESNQGTWPTDIENVERDFWALQEEGTPSTDLEEVIVEADGSVRSRGTVEGLVQWHRLEPIAAGPGALGVTVRAPSVGWEPHANVFLDGVTPQG